MQHLAYIGTNGEEHVLYAAMPLVGNNRGEVTLCSGQVICESSLQCNCEEASNNTSPFQWVLPSDTRES